MGAKRLREIEREKFDDPDYYPSYTTYTLAKKRRTEKKASIQLKSKASDSSKTSGSTTHQPTKPDDLYDNPLAHFSVVVETERTLASLQKDIPRFVKCMLPSTVEHSFWMYFPKSFCDLYLPHHNSRVVLVDDSGKEYTTTFIRARCGLSAGWRTFSILHKLKRGEMLIFQLIGTCKIKVHIVRVPDRGAINAAKTIMHMSGSCIEPDTVLKEKIEARQGRFNHKPYMLDVSSQPKDRRKCTKPDCLLCSR